MIELSPLKEEDLHLLHQWMNEPHLYPYYMQDSPSQDEVIAKFRPRIDYKGKTKSCIASLDGHKFGYVQWYLNINYPNYGVNLLGNNNGVSIDYFIGNKDFLGQNLGTQMLQQLIDTVIPQLRERDKIFYMEHDIKNKSAINCTKKSGFSIEKEYQRDNKKFFLFKRDERV